MYLCFLRFYNRVLKEPLPQVPRAREDQTALLAQTATRNLRIRTMAVAEEGPHRDYESSILYFDPTRSRPSVPPMPLRPQVRLRSRLILRRPLHARSSRTTKNKSSLICLIIPLLLRS